MKSIDTLIPDIQGLLTSGVGNLNSIPEFSSNLARRIGYRVQEERASPTLRLSNLGTPCRRKLWYSINTPGVGEPLSAEAELKFLYGDLLEETILWLAKESGHEVVGEQDEVRLEGITGHIDAIIDGTLVDVKSASSYSFNRFASHLSSDEDSFGYLVQLDAYLHASSLAGLPLLDHNRGAFLVIDKTLGKLTLDKHPRSVIDYKVLIDETLALLNKKNPPARQYQEEDFGKSGNKKLGVVCSYCQFKKYCWPGTRTFLYSTGPVYLTKVVRQPDVYEQT